MKLFGVGRNPAQDLYFAIVAHCRRPEFYRDGGVPDTVAGRFEMIVLHVGLVVRRLRTQGAGRSDGSRDPFELSDQLFEVLFADLDRSLREMGQGDIGVGKRVRQMARGFYGRAEAYDQGLGPGGDLAAALGRNLFGSVAPDPDRVAAMAAYVRDAAGRLAATPVAAFDAGAPDFPPPPAAAGH